MREDIVQKLLEGIRKYGLENVSTLSKWINIPVETARYMIWEELPKHSINIGVSINLPRIGLGRWMIEIKPANKSYTAQIEHALKQGAGIMYLGRRVPDNSTIGQLGIPFGAEHKLREQLDALKKSGVVESYALQECEWMRHLSFNPDFYDFKAREWSFDWQDIERVREPLLTPYTKQDIGESPSVDYKDILILKELRQKVPRTLSKLSESLGLDQHNLRYHYKNHARQAIQGYFLKLLPKDSSEYTAAFKFFFEPTSESSMTEARSVATSLPFSTHTWKTQKEYCWAVTCPGEYVNGVLRYVNRKFTEISGNLRLMMVDAKNEYHGPLPFELFDEATGIWKYEPKLGAAEVVSK